MFVNKLYFKEEKLKLISSFIKRMSQEASDGMVGYYDLVLKEPKLSEFKKNKKSVLLVGMGGQSAGVKAVAKALSGQQKLYILDNISSAFVQKLLAKIKLEDTKIIISSKSGTTIETLALLKLIIKKFKIKKADYKKYFYFITDEGSKLDLSAKDFSIPCFYMPANVGGRFSIFSIAGLIPLAMCGYDTSSLLKGARACYDDFFQGFLNEILQKAYHYNTKKSITINVLFSYDTRLEAFNEWYKQIIAESLGKRLKYKRLGPTPVSLIGSKDQHSFLQLLMDGPKNKSITFIKILKQEPEILIESKDFQLVEFKSKLSLNSLLKSQCDATAHVLIAAGLSVDMIEIDRLDAYHLGYLMYYYQLFTSSCALMMGINAYDQPGVEAGKIVLKNMLK